MDIPLQTTAPNRYKTGVEVSEGYDIISAAVRDGHKVYVDRSRTSDTTVTARIYASRKERFFVKIYASNKNQAEATMEELTIMTGAQVPRKQLELGL